MGAARAPAPPPTPRRPSFPRLAHRSSRSPLLLPTKSPRSADRPPQYVPGSYQGQGGTSREPLERVHPAEQLPGASDLVQHPFPFSVVELRRAAPGVGKEGLEASAYRNDSIAARSCLRLFLIRSCRRSRSASRSPSATRLARPGASCSNVRTIALIFLDRPPGLDSRHCSRRGRAKRKRRRAVLAGRCRCSDVEEVSVRGEWAAVPFVWEALRGCSVECERASDAFTAVSRGLTPCRPCGHLLGTVQALAVHLQSLQHGRGEQQSEAGRPPANNVARDGREAVRAQGVPTANPSYPSAFPREQDFNGSMPSPEIGQLPRNSG